MATGALMLVGLGGICVGTYAVLDQTAPRYLALPMLAVGVLAAVVGLLSAGRRVERTRYRPDRWRWPELVVVASGVFTGITGWWVARTRCCSPSRPRRLPELSGVALLGAAVALGGALCSPPPSVPYAAARPLRQEAVA